MVVINEEGEDEFPAVEEYKEDTSYLEPDGGVNYLAFSKRILLAPKHDLQTKRNALFRPIAR